MSNETEKPSLRFEEALQNLEAILRELEDGTTSLEESLQKYERGVALVRHCYLQLQNAEKRIEELQGIGELGEVQLAPFEHTSSAEKPSPGRRKTTPRPPASNRDFEENSES